MRFGKAGDVVKDASSDYAAGIALGVGWEVGANARCLTTHLPLLSASSSFQLVRGGRGGGSAEGSAIHSTHSTCKLGHTGVKGEGAEGPLKQKHGHLAHPTTTDNPLCMQLQ